MTLTRRFSTLAAALLVVAMLAVYAVSAEADDRLAVSGTDAGLQAAALLPTDKSSSDYQDEIDKKEAERKAAEERAEQIEHELEHTDAEIVEADRKLRALESELPALEEALDEAEVAVEAAEVEQQLVADQLASAEALERTIAAQIATDEERVAKLESLIAAIARETYKGADSSAGLGIIFGSADTQDFVDEYTAQQSSARVQSNALAELEEIAAVNRNRAVRQDAVKDHIAELKVEADALVERLRIAREAAQEARDEVQALLDEQEELRDYLESQRDKFLAQQAENEALRQQLHDSVLDLYDRKHAAEEAEAAKRAEEEAKNNNGGGGSGGGGGNSSGLGKGTLSFPTAVPYRTSKFGMRVHPIYGYERLHAGTDLRAYCGTPILAAAGGTVVWARWQGGYGNQVLLDHGLIGGKSVITNYNHLSRYAVSAGQTVARGDVVGYSGSTGTSTACHLHFEVYVSGSVVDPETLLPNFP